MVEQIRRKVPPHQLAQKSIDALGRAGIRGLKPARGMPGLLRRQLAEREVGRERRGPVEVRPVPVLAVGSDALVKEFPEFRLGVGFGWPGLAQTARPIRGGR